MKNYLSLDFESWVYPTNFGKFKDLTSLQRKSLDADYVKFSAEKILKLLSKHKTKITFFILGELYEWYPEVIDWIAKEGHEIAYHTHRHDILYDKEILKQTLKNSKSFLQKYKPKGFRAPGVLMKREYLKLIKEKGFLYDSSVYSDFQNKKEVDGILEIPISTYPLLTNPTRLEFPKSLSFKILFSQPPIGAGFFIASLGEKIRWFFEDLNKKGKPIVAFMHNWQIVRPRGAIFPSRSYVLSHPTYLPYLRNCYNIFQYLLENFEFERMKNLL